MAAFNPYLHFPGTTEAAFHFYRSVLGGDFTKVVYYKDLPPSDDFPIPEAWLDKIMHIVLPLGKGTILMGADAMMAREGKSFAFGDNFHIAISAENKAEADTLYNGLSADGVIDMPIAESPWGAYFGMFTDKYGVQWTVEFDEKENR